MIYKLLLIVILSSVTAFSQELKTFEQTLGKDKVAEILDDAVKETKKDASNEFQVTAFTLTKLQAASIPESALLQLKENFTNKLLIGTDTFKYNLKEFLDNRIFKEYGKVIIKESAGEVIVTDQCRQWIQELILKAKTTKDDAEKTLKKRVRTYLENLIILRKQTSQDNRIILDKIIVKANCFEDPCDPCCGGTCNTVCAKK